MKILPSSSDRERLKTDPTLVQEEEELLRSTTSKNTGENQNDAILHELKKDIAKIFLHEDKARAAERQHENEVRATERQYENKLKAAEHEIMIKEIQSLHIQLAVLILACVSVSVIAFFKLSK